jgi:thiosulfate/3-mercaptopyruvate sulfurtransferase
VPAQPAPGRRDNPLRSEAQLSRLVRRWGIHDGTTVVVDSIDEVDSDACLVAAVLGGSRRVRVLDGGLSAWADGGGTLSA